MNVPPYAEFIAVRTELRRVADALAALLDAMRKEQEERNGRDTD